MTSFFREVLIDFLHSRVYLGLESVFSGEVFVFILWWSVVLDAYIAAVFSSSRKRKGCGWILGYWPCKTFTLAIYTCNYLIIPPLSAPPTFVTNLLFAAFLDAASFSWLFYHVVHFESRAYMIFIPIPRLVIARKRAALSKPGPLAPAIINPARQKLLRALCTLTLAVVWRVV